MKDIPRYMAKTKIKLGKEESEYHDKFRRISPNFVRYKGIKYLKKYACKPIGCIEKSPTKQPLKSPPLNDISDTSGSKNKENFDNSDGEDLFKQIGLEDNPPANINKNDNISALKQHVNQIKDNAVKFIIKNPNNRYESEESMKTDDINKHESEEDAKDNERKNNVIKLRIQKTFEDDPITSDESQQNKSIKGKIMRK